MWLRVQRIRTNNSQINMSVIRIFLPLFLYIYVSSGFPTDDYNNTIADSERSISDTPKQLTSSEELLSEVYEHCLEKNTMSCIRAKFLLYLDQLVKDKRSIELSPLISIERNNNEDKEISEEDLEENLSRNFDQKDEYLNNEIIKRVGRFLRTHDFKFHLPELFFENAIVTISPNLFASDGPNFSIDFPNDGRKITEGKSIQHISFYYVIDNKL